MNRYVKLTLIALLAVAFSLAVWQSMYVIGPKANHSVTPVEVHEPLSAEPYVESVEAGSEDEARAPVAVPTEEQQQDTSIEDRPILTGRVVDELGAGLAGALVSVVDRPAATFNFLDLEHADEEHIVDRLVADGGGEFSVRLEPLRPYELRATAEGYGRSVAAEARAGQHVVIRMARAATISGHVTRASDGTPVDDAKIHYYHGAGENQEGFVSTDANGTYVIPELVPGPVSLRAIPAREIRSSWVELDCEADRRLEHDFVVEEGRSISGQVRDAVTKEPIANAEVSSWSFLHKTVRTNAAGEFRLEGLSPDRLTTASVRADGYARREVEIRFDAEELIWTLSPGRTVAGRIVRRSGDAVAGAYVAAVSITLSERVDWLSTRSDVDGRFELSALPAAERATLYVHKCGLAPNERAIESNAPAGETVELGDIVLDDAASIEGRVQSDDGEPIPHVAIALAGPGNVKEASDHYLHVRNFQADDEGRFACADLAAGRYSVRLNASGRVPVRGIRFDLDVGEQRRGLEFVIEGATPLFGTVVDSDGEVVAGATVSIAPEGGAAGGGRTTTTSDSEGSFRFADVAMSTYTLTAQVPGTWTEPATLAPTTITGVKPANASLEVRLVKETERITGVVQSADGALVAQALVFVARDLMDVSGVELPRRAVFTDEIGSFTVHVPAGPSVELRARATANADKADRTITVSEFRSGRFVLPPESGEARLRNVAPGATGVVLVLEL